MREARRARRMGFDKVAEELAGASVTQKLTEPNIMRAEDRVAMQDIQAGAQEAAVAKRQEDAQQQLAGRVGFASELKQRAAGNDENLFGYAKMEAPKYGVTPSALASFFERNKLPFNSTTEQKGIAPAANVAGSPADKDKQNRPVSNYMTNSLLNRR